MQIRNVRFIIAAITTFGAYAVYVSRVNLSIAIIAMVDDQHASEGLLNQTPQRSATTTTTTTPNPNIRLNSTSGNLLSAGHSNDWPPFRESTDENNATISALASPPTIGANSIFPASKKSINFPIISQHKFHWDQTEQGHILGAFFYGYVLFQIPGARIAESVGAKWILFTGIFSSAVISLVFPLSTQLNSLHLLMLLRFIMGLSQSAFFPAAYVLFCRWLPEKERSILLPIMFIGSNVGSISTYIMSSYLISSSYGWPSVFYVSGFICLIISLLWYVFVSSEPEDNWLITDEECKFIKKNVCNQSSEINSLNDQSIRTNSSSNISLNSSVSLANFTKHNEPNNHHFIVDNINVKLSVKKTLDTTTLSFEREDSLKGTIARRRNSFGYNYKTLGSIHHHDNKNISRKSTPLLSAYFSPNANANVDDNNWKKKISREIIEKKGRDEVKNTTTTTTNNNNNNGTVVSPEPSWNKLLTSIPIWTLVLSMYGNEWSNVVLCYELPTYLNTALNFPIEQNGVINSFFQLSFAVASPIMSSLGAYMLDRHLLGMRKIHVRKLFQSLATFGQLLCFISVPICGSNRGLIIMFMFAAIVFKSCANAGDIMVSGDLSPEYAGTIFAFANSVGNTAGVFVPEFAGLIVKNPYDRERWTPFWLTTAAIMGFSGTIFLIFGVTRRQEFGPDVDRIKDESNLIELPKGGLDCCPSLAIELPSQTLSQEEEADLDLDNNNNNEHNLDSYTNIRKSFTAQHSHLN